MSDNVQEQLTEFISNSQIAFVNGRYHDSFYLAKEAIKLDPKCANAYQCATISKISDSFGDFIHSLYVEGEK